MSARAIRDAFTHAGMGVSETEAEGMLSDPLVRRNSALVAYARDLMDRISGFSGHEASLALWRRFAYTDAGAPIKNFALTHEAVLEAVQFIKERHLPRRSRIP